MEFIGISLLFITLFFIFNTLYKLMKMFTRGIYNEYEAGERLYFGNEIRLSEVRKLASNYKFLMNARILGIYNKGSLLSIETPWFSGAEYNIQLVKYSYSFGRIFERRIDLEAIPNMYILEEKLKNKGIKLIITEDEEVDFLINGNNKIIME